MTSCAESARSSPASSRTATSWRRIGGDEFAVITSRPGTEAVRALCGRLTAALVADGMSMSFGWAVCPRDGDSALLLYRAADERLYAQKLIRSRLTSAEVISHAGPRRAARAALTAPARYRAAHSYGSSCRGSARTSLLPSRKPRATKRR